MLELPSSLSLFFCLSFWLFLEQMFSANSCQFILYSGSFKLAAIAEVYVFGLQQFNRPHYSVRCE